MEQSYTDLDLIRFIYGEVEICEHFEIDFAISEDSQLEADYKALKESKNLLPKIHKAPSSKSLESILSYSRKSEVNSLV